MREKELLRRVLAVLAVGAVVAFIFWYGRRLGGGFQMTQDTPRKVSPEEIMDVLPRDRIPSIDNPEFESAESADAWLAPSDIVFGLDYQGEVRVYPQKILNWHEIVNDQVGGEAVAVTFCPLCGSSLAFRAVLEGKSVQFGVSGKLRNSNLVMYNRDPNPAQESLWSQITGEAIVGVHTGETLEQIPIDTTTWERWKASHPGTQVLSRESGDYPASQYEVYPYGDYETSRQINFPVGHRDERLHQKAVVYGVVIDGVAKAYPIDKFSAGTRISDKVGSISVRLSWDGKNFRVERTDTGEEVVPVRNFWFAWVAFYPETELY